MGSKRTLSLANWWVSSRMPLAATPQEAREKLKQLRNFRATAAAFWRIPTKSKGYVPFHLTPGQLVLDNEYERQMDERGFVRINALKCRQVGGTTWSRSRAHHYVTTRTGVSALTVAHEGGMPTRWLQRCKELYDQTPAYARPIREAARENAHRYNLGSTYYIGSAQAGFPGVGDTVHFLHLSELGRWDKPPISVDPVAVLYPLQPAIPTGDDRKGTVCIRESTGVMRGDYWHTTWMAGKQKANEYKNLFLPWFLVPTYRRDDLVSDVLSLSDYEQDVVRIAQGYGIALDHAQLAWRRSEVQQDPFWGNVALWSAEMPATEEESFMAPGQSIYTPEEVELARATCREPIWRGNILGIGKPEQATYEPSGHGECTIWEYPDERYHYVEGADCMWGKKKENDFDVSHIECLETGRLCAKIKGQYSMPDWAWRIAALGHRYNTAVLAPERNAVAGSASDGVIATLLGNVTNWRYPNLWVRSDDMKLRGYRPEDYGWWTSHTSKGELIAFSLTQTHARGFDWGDSDTVDQMSTIIRHDDNSIGAPTGQKDDDWMSRMITAYVSHRERPKTNLFVEPVKRTFTFTTPEQRVQQMLEEATGDTDDGIG